MMGKKRTFRELERWDIDHQKKEKKMKRVDSSNSMFNFK